MIGNPVGLPGTNAVAGTIGPAVTILSRYGRVMFAAAADEVALVDLAVDPAS